MNLANSNTKCYFTEPAAYFFLLTIASKFTACRRKVHILWIDYLLNMAMIVFFFSDADIWKHTLVSVQLTDAIKSNKLKQIRDFLYAEVALIWKYMQYKVILIVPIGSFSVLDGLWYKLAAESPHTRDHVTSLVRTISHVVSAIAQTKEAALLKLKQKKRIMCQPMRLRIFSKLGVSTVS